jgi:TRCF domain
MLYRKVAAARRIDEIDRVLDEAEDRYGPLPPSVLNLADYARIRIMAERLGIESIDREGRNVVLTFRPQARLDPGRLVAVVRSRSDLTLVPPASVRVLLGEGGPAVPAPGLGKSAPKGGLRAQGSAKSWWTARAREGSVKPGFSKEEILKPAREDPRTTGGLFERVGSVLSQLLDQG